SRSRAVCAETLSFCCLARPLWILRARVLRAACSLMELPDPGGNRCRALGDRFQQQSSRRAQLYVADEILAPGAGRREHVCIPFARPDSPSGEPGGPPERKDWHFFGA